MKKRIVSLVLLPLALNVMMYAEEKGTKNFEKYYEIEKAKCTKTIDALGFSDGTKEKFMQLIEKRLDEKGRSHARGLIEDEQIANAQKHSTRYRMVDEDEMERKNRLYIGSDVPCSTLTIDDIVECQGYSSSETCKVVGSDRSFYSDFVRRQLRNDLNINQYDSNVVSKILTVYDQESNSFLHLDTLINKSSGYLLTDNTLANKIGKTLANFYKYHKISNLKSFGFGESNPYQQDGSLYMGSGIGRLFQIMKANEGLYEVGDYLIYVKSIGNAPSSLSGKYLVKNGVYKYRTTGGYENTIPLFKEIKVDFSNNAKWFVK